MVYSLSMKASGVWVDVAFLILRHYRYSANKFRTLSIQIIWAMLLQLLAGKLGINTRFLFFIFLFFFHIEFSQIARHIAASATCPNIKPGPGPPIVWHVDYDERWGIT